VPKGPSGRKRKAAMAARLTNTLWDIGDIVKMIEAWENDSAGTEAA
jgi:hypothetical protein